MNVIQVSGIDLARRERVEHECIVGVRTMGNVDVFLHNVELYYNLILSINRVLPKNSAPAAYAVSPISATGCMSSSTTSKYCTVARGSLSRTARPAARI